jgi:SAM-dependent methyltransferase
MTCADQDTIRAEAWLEVTELLDFQPSPLGQCAIEALAPKKSEAIIDVGCGAGQTVLQLADRVGPKGQVIGVDIAPLLLERARVRAARLSQVEFIECDATELCLPKKSMDCVYSRFGVMGFADPIAAFSNLHSLMKPSGRLAFVCWRSLEENELDIMPLRAAALEERADMTPFRFESPQFTRSVLLAAGFQSTEICPHDRLVSSGGLEEMLNVLLKVGAVGKIVRENPRMRELVEDRLRAALASRMVQGQVALNAAIWVVTATA